MLVLTAEEIRKALPMKDTFEAMKRAYASLSDGKAEVPLRARLNVPPQEAVSLIMPAFVRTAGRDAMAVKVVNLFPKNPSRGLAFIQAAILVCEAETGRPVALLEGSALTAIRTGAGSGAAIPCSSRPAPGPPAQASRRRVAGVFPPPPGDPRPPVRPRTRADSREFGMMPHVPLPQPARFR